MGTFRASREVVDGGAADVRAALRRWRATPVATLRPWVRVAMAVAVALIVATGVVAAFSTPDRGGFDLAGVTRPGKFADVIAIVERNLLVLALHAMACTAAYLARRSLRMEAARYGPFWRSMNERVGTVAIGLVACATLFSFGTQSLGLGRAASTVAAGLHVNPAVLLVGLTPHAIPELVAVFLPLAAWWVAGRRGQWNDLMAATFLTVALAVPVIVFAALVEVYASPHLVTALARRA